MPRSGPQGTATPPPGTFPKNPGDIIPSAAWNQLFTDLYLIDNTPTPIAYGGTGQADLILPSNLFGLKDTTDPTKIASFDLSAIPTATARTYILPATSGTLALTSQITPLASKVDTRRNRVVNGDKLVSQENAQTSGTTNGRYISDQNAMYFVSSAGVFTGVNVQTISPAGGYRDRITITTADASLAAGEYLTYTQNIEGSNIRDAKWGTAGAVPIIVRRGFKFPAGTYTVAFHNSAVTRSYVTSFVVSGGEANTDIVREFAIPGDTTGTWLSADGVIGLVMDVVIAAGTTFQTTANAWQAGNFLTIAGTTNGIGTAAAVFEFFDEGLKLDPDATGSYGVYQAGEVDAVYRSERYLPVFTSPSRMQLAVAQAIAPDSARMVIPLGIRTCKPVTGSIGSGAIRGLTAGGASLLSFSGFAVVTDTSTFAIAIDLTSGSGLVAGNASMIYLDAGGKLVFTGARL